MARKVVAEPTKLTLKIIVFSLFLCYVSSQGCTDPLPTTCMCTMETFNCTSANLTEFSSDLPNKESLRHISLSSNNISSIDLDVLSAYTQLQTLSLAGNGLTHIQEQSLPVNFTQIDLSSNPLICDASLVWLTMVPQITGSCASGEDITSFLDTLKPTAADSSSTQHTPMMDIVTDIVTEPSSHTTVGNTTTTLESNKLYVLAIIIPILVLVVICTVVVIFSVRKSNQQKEAYNSSIRYSVVRKDAGAGNRVYSDVTTEL